MKKPEEFITRLKELRFGGYRISQSIDTCLREWEGVEIVVPIKVNLWYNIFNKEICSNEQKLTVINEGLRDVDDFMTLREAIERKIIEL